MNRRRIQKRVEGIISAVRRRGDQALFSYARQYDKIKLTAGTVKVPVAQLRSAPKEIDSTLRKALDASARRVRYFHQQEKKRIASSWTTVKEGVRLGQIFRPIDAVGLYVPGGRFSYPSTVLMAAIPARMAGVKRIVMVSPPQNLKRELLAAAQIAGVTEVYRVGGPAALAALALGTASVPQVDFIVGPGNAYVTEAKRQLFGEVGIDLLAGPSELVVLADDSSSAEFIAADMSAQVEHDPDSRSTLVCVSKQFLTSVKKAVPPPLIKQCRFLYRRTMRDAIKTVNALAGEHVEVMIRRPQNYLGGLKNGGTLFLKRWSATAMGDYWAGPSHILPTGRSARYGSGLSVMTFLKRTSLVEISARAFQKGWKTAYALAKAEGLYQHARSLKMRGESR